MPPRPWSPPAWGAAHPLQPGGTFRAVTNFAPTVIGHAGQFHCLWVQQEATEFHVYHSTTSLEDNMIWSPQQRLGLVESPEQASTSPAMAVLDGVLHAVFPDEGHNLVHFQFDAETGIWGGRSGLLAGTRSVPSLAAFAGTLFCVFRDVTSDALLMTSWTRASGWHKPLPAHGVNDTAGQVAIFELAASLQLLAVDRAVDNNQKIKRYQFSAPENSWKLLQTTDQPPEIAPVSGVAARCVNNIAFAACKKGDLAVTLQLERNQWYGNQQVSTFTKSIPAIAIHDNEVLCVWNDNAGILQWATRDAIEIPQLDRWMSLVRPGTLVSALTIPGTHDAAAISKMLFVGTQSLTIEQQLYAGIRYFDLRAGFGQISPNILVAYHGPYAISGPQGFFSELPISDIFQACYTFLAKAEHRNEGVIIQVKQDYQDKDPTQAARFAEALKVLIAGKPWRLDATVPTIDQIRGHIQLVRRFNLPANTPAFGIDVSGTRWADNSDAFTIQNAVGTSAGRPVYTILQVQDHFNMRSGLQDKTKTIAEQKFQIVKAHLDRAVAGPLDSWYINFASAVIPGSTESWEIALTGSTYPIGPGYTWTDGVNGKLRAFFNDVAGSKRYGTILLDDCHLPSELILAIVKTNFFGVGPS